LIPMFSVPFEFFYGRFGHGTLGSWAFLNHGVNESFLEFLVPCSPPVVGNWIFFINFAYIPLISVTYIFSSTFIYNIDI
jgi:hypothetical protein